MKKRSSKSCFAEKVYKIVKSIPFGETRSYQWVAEKIGRKKTVRSIGQILKKNPYPLVIPCHRVIKKDGSVGGYIFGEELKRNLIAWERQFL